MTTEQDKTLEALKIAIKMEIEGKEYYLKASQESNNELGRKLLQTLAAEEDVHRQKFEEIYTALRDRNVWPEVHFQPDGGKRLRTIFVRVTGEVGSNVEAVTTELDAVQTAMNLENKTHDFYENQGKSALYEAEREFYNTLATEEREHYLILLDYQEYLKDPAGWFVQKEHPSLDGG